MAGPLDNALAILGGGQQQAAPAAPAPAAQVPPSDPVWQIPPGVQRQRDGDRLTLLQNELSSAQDPASRAALQREIASTQQGIQAPQGSPAPAQQGGALSGALAILNGKDTAWQKAPAEPPPGLIHQVFSRAIGMNEMGLHTVSGLLGSAAGGWAGILSGGDPDAVKKVSNALTYEPRTDSGKAAASGMAQGMAMLTQAPGIKQVLSGFDTVADKAGEMSPVAGAVIRTLPAAVGLLAAPEVRGAFGGALRPLSEIGKVAEIAPRIEPALAKPRVKLNVDGTTTPVTPAPASAPGAPPAGPAAAPGASSALPVSTGPTLPNASPELQQAVAELQKRGAPFSQEVLSRHLDADTLPVSMKLTEGQATLNPDMISNEMNGRGKAQPSVSPDFYNQQGKQLGQNLDAIRAKVAPDMSAIHPTEAGQTLIDRYKAMDEPVVQDINAKYKALRDANGGQFPVDAGQLLTNVRGALRKELLSNDAPASQMGELERLATDGNMTYEDFLSMRRNLGNVARTAADGNTRTAASIMTRQLENLPLSPEASALTPLADQARAAARARFSRLDADPAYKAAINDGVAAGEPSPLADKFVQSYVTGDNARLANLKQMKANLGDDQVARQTIAASTLDHLQAAAKADPGTGKFLSDMYGKRVTALAPKLEDLVGPEAAQQLQQVGRVAKYTSAQPRGSYVNNSGTLVGALSTMGKEGLSALASIKTMGASKVAEAGIDAYKARQAAARATAPGAGIRIKDLPK